MRNKVQKLCVLSLSLLVLCFVSCQKEDGYELKGSVEGLKDGYIYLQVMGVDGPIKVDSTEVFDNEFIFEGVVKKPTLCYLGQGDNLRGAIIIFVENTNISVEGVIDNLGDVKIEGSETQDAFKIYKDRNDTFILEKKKLKAKYNDLLRDPEDKISAINKMVDVIARLVEEQKQYQLNYIKEHPNSYVSPYILNNLSYNLDLTELDSLYALMTPSVRQSYEGQCIENRIKILKSTQIGAIAPDFTMPDINGNPVRLSDIYSNNKYTLIDFWASWCSPCRIENPNIVNAYRKFNEKGFGVLGVSLDKNRSSLLRAIGKDGIIWPNVSDFKGWRNSAAELYGIKSIPSNILVDREGRIVARNLREQSLHNKLEELL
ncbi:TlpA disulfide reductase family protein [Prolixibacteraceae bacterium]|nr:TlpA disulfide reductase family protein [Prolixibacteraceae bacterium]